MMGGRGLGKTWGGSGFVVNEVKAGRARDVALISDTAADVRDVMIENESGILSASRAEGLRVRYQPSRRSVVWPDYGATATAFSAEDPDQTRGYAHDLAWADEIRSWKRGEAAWDSLMLTMRLGARPRVLATTTPLPLKWIRKLLDDPQTAITRGSTLDNLDNLSPLFRETILKRYEGTRLERQEVFGEMIEDVEGALWTREKIESTRVRPTKKKPLPDFIRVAVGVDPPGSIGTECGIVAAGLDAAGEVYVTLDYSAKGLPPEWAARVASCFSEARADRVVAETNYGGDMVKATIQVVSPTIPVRKVTATRGKAVRAEPVAAYWEQGRGHIVGSLPELEDELCNWTPGSPDSPNRLDALVWAVTYLDPARGEVQFERA
jgi:phage terminase large subunit-like protein